MRLSLITVWLGYSLGFDSIERHPGESLAFPNERTSLNDCHLRYYIYNQFYRDPGYNGIVARLFEFAHMGAIGWSKSDGSIDWRCGGSLISERFVLTAAHCAIDSRNTPPDVVRFGDLDIFGPEGDDYAQQLGIAEIVRHPEHRFAAYYHDIALIRLVRSVSIGKAVAPACIWPHHEVRFTHMVAVGWGRVGFAGNQSPVLLKMAQSPIQFEDCGRVYNNETIRKLRNGLHAHHMCASDALTDTCEGDSGGPLQVKLTHNFRETPFIVGITSFGLPCGTSNPGVYTRVAPYLEWIVATMRDRGERVNDQTFNTTTCARWNVVLRDPYEGIVQLRNGTHVEINYAEQHFRLQDELPPFIAKLGWDEEPAGADHCYGVIIDEDTVLTVADCIDSAKPARRIVSPAQIDVAAIHVHPEYIKGSSYNNIAILKLKTLLDFRYGTFPSCIWHDSELPYPLIRTIGIGRRDLVEKLQPGQPVLPNPAPITYIAKITAFKESSCHLSNAILSRMRHGMAFEHVCAGNDFFLVPEVCNLATGGPLFGTYRHNNRQYGYTFALAQFGRDCGFGEHLIATRLWSHVDWMKSVLLPGQPKQSSRFLFLDRDRHEGSSCTTGVGIRGRCVPLVDCFRSRADFLNLTGKQFCSSTDVICCPLDVIQKQKESQADLGECPKIVKRLNVKNPYGYLVELGPDCLGSIISPQLIVTTKSCLNDSIPKSVQPLSDRNISLIVENVTYHKEYNASDSSFDIALLKIKTPISWNPNLYPACLWMNQTHTPLVTRLLQVAANAQVTVEMLQAQYNSDCQRVHPNELHRSQLCARSPWYEPVCGKPGDVLVSLSSPESNVTYLVGMGLREDGCERWDYGTFTRMSQLVDWIQEKKAGEE